MSIQQTIIRGIKEQLFFNDYLVLPDFGGFVLKSNPSHFSTSGGSLVPPSKTVSFNAQLKQNDGILAIWLQNALKCHASEALNHLKDFSEFCSGILSAKRRLSLEGIGFFYLDFENNICFEPQQDANFLTLSFGLAPVSIKELASEVSAEPKKETVFIDRSPDLSTTISVQTPKTRRNFRRLTTPVLLSAVLITLLGLLVNNVSIKGELRSTMLGENTKGAYNAVNYADLGLIPDPAKNPAYVADANGIAILELEETKKVAVKAIDNTFNTLSSTHSVPGRLKRTHSKDFEIVLGCFAVLENANRMVSKLSAQGVKVSVTGRNNKGMYVVGNGSFATKEEAVVKLMEVKNLFPHAWIKKGE